ncbi:UNVERIFIED_CONTAM: hypothetical protein Q9R58_01755 [Methylobacteriaceae bacterium AG10]|nr:hypothetical protein [Methylobacteriaceae bacterium AG10]
MFKAARSAALVPSPRLAGKPPAAGRFFRTVFGDASPECSALGPSPIDLPSITL